MPFTIPQKDPGHIPGECTIRDPPQLPKPYPRARSGKILKMDRKAYADGRSARTFYLIGPLPEP